MIPIVNKKYKYIFYYNPKSACSFYRNVYVELHRNELEQALGFEPDKKHLAKHFKPKRFKWYYNYYRFSIVRNPFDRVVSGFLNKCVEVAREPNERFITEHFINTIHAPIFQFLDRKMDLEGGYTFENLLDYLLNNIRKNYVNPHFDLQYNKNVKLDSFYKIEDPQENFLSIYKTIFRKHNHKITELENILLAFSKRSSGKNITRKENKPTLTGEPLYNKSFNELYQLGRVYNFNYQDFLNPSIKEKIVQIYQPDFSLFKYSTDAY